MPTKHALRVDLDQAEKLAEARRDRADKAVAYANLLLGQKIKLQRRHDALLQIVAAHLTPELRAAVDADGFHAELEWALLDPRSDGEPGAVTP